MLRKIEPVDLDGEEIYWSGQGTDDDGLDEPVIEWGNPADLYVDDDYQRDVGKTGLRLIKRVAKKGWKWRKFKPPVVTITPTGEKVIVDGQHTAIMAVSRGVTRIPWILVKTRGTADQADAFVGQNADRTAMSIAQRFIAECAAGDEDALTVKKVCAAADITLRMWNNGSRGAAWKPGECMAISTIKSIIYRRFPVGAGRVLRALRAADLAPITVEHLRAVEEITALLKGAVGAGLMSDAGMFAAQHRVPMWKGLVTVLFRNKSRVIA